jgi:very-short-patch-repair endonuclease
MVRKPMSVPEQVLYFRLLEALPEHIVLAQVQLSRFLGVKRGHPVQAWLNRINRLSVDFLVLKKDATVVAAIELDDKTHQRSDRRAADARKDRALADAGVKLVRWNVADMPNPDRIRSDLTASRSEPHTATTGGRIEPVLAAGLPTAPQRLDARTATKKRALS